MKELLLEIGFKRIYHPSEKKWSENQLIWYSMYGYGESICIKLLYENEEYTINELTIQGKNTYLKYRELVLKFELEEIINFVRNNPNSTNP
jgi:ABC-type tungstate transport system permease subunit